MTTASLSLLLEWLSSRSHLIQLVVVLSLTAAPPSPHLQGILETMADLQGLSEGAHGSQKPALHLRTHTGVKINLSLHAFWDIIKLY